MMLDFLCSYLVVKVCFWLKGGVLAIGNKVIVIGQLDCAVLSASRYRGKVDVNV